MTLTEIKNQLITFFLKNDTFFSPKDLKSIKVSKNQEFIKNELVSSVLDQMEKDGMIKKITPNTVSTDYNYSATNILPFSMLGQTVEIGAQTAELISEIVNQYNESSGNKSEIVDKLNITEMDIQKLGIITAQLLNGLDGESQEEKDE